jgi:tRNA threonylcarbamoyladenosine biosynthesis protein TsaB
MAYILNIDTATTNCSVSVSKNKEIVSLFELNEKGYSHAENLHAFIRQAIEKAGITLAALDAIAISKGPGSYTGLRIGVSAAKGLCFALNKPLISVPTLDVLARKIEIEEGVIVAMLDARRMEVYSALYDLTYTSIRKTEAQIIDENSFASLLPENKLHFIGNGAAKCMELITHKNAIFHTELEVPSAREMALLSNAKLQDKAFEDVAYFEPYYLKDFMGTKKKN